MPLSYNCSFLFFLAEFGSGNQEPGSPAIRIHGKQEAYRSGPLWLLSSIESGYGYSCLRLYFPAHLYKRRSWWDALTQTKDAPPQSAAGL